MNKIGKRHILLCLIMGIGSGLFATNTAEALITYGSGVTNLSDISYTDRTEVRNAGSVINFSGNNTVTVTGNNYNGYGIGSFASSSINITGGSSLTLEKIHSTNVTFTTSPDDVFLRENCTLTNDGTLTINDKNTTAASPLTGFQVTAWILDNSKFISNGALNINIDHPTAVSTLLYGVHSKGKSLVELYGPTNININAEERRQRALDSMGAQLNVYSPQLNVNINSLSTDPTSVNLGLIADYDPNNALVDGALNAKPGSNINVHITGPSSTNIGVKAQDQSIVTLENGSTLNVKIDNGLNSYGLWLENPLARLYADGDIDIDVKGDNSIGAYVVNGGTLELNGNVSIISDKYSLQADGTGTNPTLLNVNKNGGSTVKITGDAHTNGPNATINMKLDKPESYFTGLALLGSDSSGATEGTITIDASNKGTWNMTGSSKISSLTMNDAVVNMTLNGTYKELGAGSMTGSGGHIIMNTNLQDSKALMNVNGESDRITIDGASSGHYILDINDESILSGNKAEGYLLLVTDKAAAGKDVNNLATFEGGNLRKGGIFKYKPVVTDKDPDATSGYGGVPTAGVLKNWYLAATENTGELTESVQPVLGSIESRYVGYQLDMDTLLRRMGELRDNEGDAGIWARYRKGESNIYGNIYKYKFQSIYVGLDRELKEKDSPDKRFIGAAFGHTWADHVHAQAGTGTSGMNTLTIYDTWLGGKGHYLDLVGKAGKMYSDFAYLTDNYWNRNENGDSDNWYYSLSGEYGRKLPLGNDGWYTEPQAQLTYGRITGSNFKTAQGTEVNTHAINSLIGRAGFTLGHKEGGKDHESNVYAKLFFNKDFMGDIKADLHDTYNDNFAMKSNLGSTWGTFGIGFTTQMDKKADMYLDLEKNFGGDIRTNWIWNVGLRYNF